MPIIDSFSNHTITIEVTVFDAEAVKAAALERAIKEGHTAESWAEIRGDLGSDLVMLFDPGVSPDGLIIQQTSTEAIRL